MFEIQGVIWTAPKCAKQSSGQHYHIIGNNIVGAAHTGCCFCTCVVIHPHFIFLYILMILIFVCAAKRIAEDLILLFIVCCFKWNDNKNVCEDIFHLSRGESLFFSFACNIFLLVTTTLATITLLNLKIE